MKNLAVVARLVPVFLLPLACGSSSGGNNIVGGPSCTVATCGGDIVGTWNPSEVCADKSVFMTAFLGGLMGQCPGANVGAVNFAPTGSMVFNADMSYSITLSIAGSISVNIPGSCLNGATCTDLGAQLQSAFAGDPSIQSVSCTGSGTCACPIVMAPEQTYETGTYTVSGSTLMTTPTGSTTADSQQYCVKGTTVTFPEPAMTQMQSGLVALVAQKQ